MVVVVVVVVVVMVMVVVAMVSEGKEATGVLVSSDCTVLCLEY